LHTSYWLSYGGGYKRRGTFIEYSKNFIDYINAYHSMQRRLKINSFTQSAYSLHYYDSVLVIEKRKKEKPGEMTSGIPSFPVTSTPFTFSKKIIKGLNLIMRFLGLKNIG
jgi:hypothetical protein